MSLDKTISTIFVVPTLKIGADDLKQNEFINGYSWDLKKEVNYEDSIYLLFKPKNLDRFKHFLDHEYQKGDASMSPLIEDYDYPGGFIVLVYNIDLRYKRDFELVKQGKYSKTSKDFQDIFKRTVIVVENGYPKEKTSLQWKIFNKSDDMKSYWEEKIAIDFKDDMEVWQIWEDEKEILDIDKIRELL